MAFYTVEEMERGYAPSERMLFGRRSQSYVMTPEQADCVVPFQLVTLNRSTGLYQRVQITGGDELRVITEAKDQALGNHVAAEHNGNRLRH